jgi:hypothetical protein
MKKYIILLLMITSLHAETTLTCQPQPQSNDINALWTCPVISDKTKANLSDIDLVSGTYICTYYYKSTGRMATSCQHTSSTYLSETKKYFKNIDKKAREFTKIDFDTDANILTGTTAPDSITTLQTLTNDVIAKLNNFYTEAIENKDDGISAVDTEIAHMQKTIYNHLKKPYVSNEEGLVKNGNTFSRFLTGMATLDPDVVKGYDEASGELLITNDWKSRASEISAEEQGLIDKLKSYLPWTDDDPMLGIGNIMKDKSNESNTLDTDIYNVASWIDIFSMKIWGYYYNFNRNLDIGFDKLSMSILFMFLIFFGAGLALKGGTSFALGRGKGGNRKDFVLSEKGTMKILSIMGIFVIFFISIPSNISSNNIVTDSTDIRNEMKTNMSLYKTYIRYVAKEGSYYGDMFSDLGTSAFLDYVIKKQGLYTGNEIRSLFNSDVRQMAYYYPSLQLARECENYYGLPFNKFVSTPDMTQYSVQPNYTSAFLTGNNINSIDFKLCANMHKNLIMIPNQIATSAATTLAKMENVDKVRAKATKYLIQNHVLLQDRLGWINIASVPYTYFMMKNQDLFFESGLDYDAIDEKTKQYISNVGLKDGGDIEMNNLGFFDWMDTGTGKIRDNGAKASAYVASSFTKFAYYNFLPGFSSIKRSIYEQIKAQDRALNDDDADKALKNNKMLSKYMSKIKSNFALLPSLVKNIGKEAFIQWVSYVSAMVVWKEAFNAIIIALIGVMVTARALMLIYFLFINLATAPFMMLWAFKGGSNVGMHQIKNYARNTLLLAFSPVLISISVGLFIFIQGAFEALTAFITSGLVEQQMHMVSLAITGTNKLEQEAFLSYLSLYAVKDIVEIVLMVLSVIIAYQLLFKLEPYVKKQLGINDGSVSEEDNTVENITKQGDKNVNPLSK